MRNNFKLLNQCKQIKCVTAVVKIAIIIGLAIKFVIVSVDCPKYIYDIALI